MVRVPNSGERPTFDDVFTVGLFAWYFRTPAAQRVEWARRRNVAADAARRGQVERARQRFERGER
jgi:hypothetical protein